MSRRREDTGPRPRRSPVQTVADATDDHMDSLGLPQIPGRIPDRIVKALQRRVEALLYELDQSRHDRYIAPLEIRLVRDSHRAVLTLCELGLPQGEVHYARFREIIEAMGYERTEVGFSRGEG